MAIGQPETRILRHFRPDAPAEGRFVGISDAGTLIGFGLSNNAQIDRLFIAPRGFDGARP